MFERGIKYFVCPEMRKLRNKLNKNGIAWEDKSEKGDGLLWMCRTHFNYKGFFWSVIHGIGSYGGIMPGARIGGVLLEVMSNALDENPIGSLTAKEIWKLMQEAPDCSEEKKDE